MNPGYKFKGTIINFILKFKEFKKDMNKHSFEFQEDNNKCWMVSKNYKYTTEWSNKDNSVFESWIE